MKRSITLLAALFMVAAMAASASAETVNLGIVQLEKQDLTRIQGLVSGSESLACKTTAPAKDSEVNLGLIRMDATELAALKDTVSGNAAPVMMANSTPQEKLVNVGPVELAASDLQSIQRQVKDHFKDGSPLLKKMHLAFNR